MLRRRFYDFTSAPRELSDGVLFTRKAAAVCNFARCCRRHILCSLSPVVKPRTRHADARPECWIRPQALPRSNGIEPGANERFSKAVTRASHLWTAFFLLLASDAYKEPRCRLRGSSRPATPACAVTASAFGKSSRNPSPISRPPPPLPSSYRWRLQRPEISPGHLIALRRSRCCWSAIR